MSQPAQTVPVRSQTLKDADDLCNLARLCLCAPIHVPLPSTHMHTANYTNYTVAASTPTTRRLPCRTPQPLEKPPSHHSCCPFTPCNQQFPRVPRVPLPTLPGSGPPRSMQRPFPLPYPSALPPPPPNPPPPFTPAQYHMQDCRPRPPPSIPAPRHPPLAPPAAPASPVPATPAPPARPAS